MSLDITKTTDVQQSLVKLLENRQWLDKKIYELQKEYRGKTIAVHGQGVVGTGETAEEVYNAVKDKYPIDEVLIMLIPKEEILVVPYPE
ncbi:MAG: DUF5678 domain-containing protein [Thermodesulfobacteriota bacterium]|nr:DUF5678 domain-containing protein [Thermodesulfobacteriota bacterium]